MIKLLYNFIFELKASHSFDTKKSGKNQQEKKNIFSEL